MRLRPLPLLASGSADWSCTGKRLTLHTRPRAGGLDLNASRCPGVPGDLTCSTLPSPPFNATLPGGILVPFPVQSALSGVRAVPPNGVGWMRRELSLAELRRRPGERLLIHVERCDFNCSVYFDGALVGWHAGGYEHFTLDVTSFVDARRDSHEVLVGFDDRDVSQPSGKQSDNAFDHPGGIFYTSTSGVWDSVWLEVVPRVYIRDVRLEPSLSGRTLAIEAELCADGGQRFGVGLLNCSAPTATAPPRVVRAELLWQGAVVAQGSGHEGAPLVLTIPRSHELRPWSPSDPAMYEARVSLSSANASQPLDVAVLTTAFRDLSIGRRGQFARALLNDEALFASGVLQQGFWPDGVCEIAMLSNCIAFRLANLESITLADTAPTDAALENDFLVIKQLGFNAFRVHMKVESRRFYHHADRLGIMILQDMPRCAMGGCSNGRLGCCARL